MTLADLIRKRNTPNLATAIPAIPATQDKGLTATVARVATVAVANPPAPLTSQDEANIRAWLKYIGEADPVELARVWARCRTRLDARAYVLERAAEVPPAPARDYSAICGACRHFRRIAHPHLGHCDQGEPEAIAGLWNSDHRWCERFARTTAPAPDRPTAHQEKRAECC